MGLSGTLLWTLVISRRILGRRLFLKIAPLLSRLNWEMGESGDLEAIFSTIQVIHLTHLIIKIMVVVLVSLGRPPPNWNWNCNANNSELKFMRWFNYGVPQGSRALLT